MRQTTQRDAKTFSSAAHNPSFSDRPNPRRVGPRYFEQESVIRPTVFRSRIRLFSGNFLAGCRAILEEIPMTWFLLAWAYLIAGEITVLLALADDEATASVQW